MIQKKAAYLNCGIYIIPSDLKEHFKDYIDEMYKKEGLRESLKAVRKQHILIKDKGTEDG